jgi:hypothetical protein
MMVEDPTAIVHELQVLQHLVRQLLERLGTEAGRSSVEVKTSTRGVDIAVKSYAGSSPTEAGDAAIEEFVRVGREIEKRLMGQAA